MDLIERSAGRSRRHPWEIARARFFIELIDRLVAPPVTTVLDVGSGDAWFARQLASAHPELDVTCWDVNYTAEELTDLKGEADGMSFCTSAPGGEFDVVLMMDVIEHVEDDAEFVRSTVDERMGEDGWLLVSVPAYQSLYTSHDKWLKHFRRYSPREGRALLESVGLAIEAEGGLFHSLLPVRGLVALKERVRPVRAEEHGIGGWEGGPLVTRATTALLDADARISLWLGSRTTQVVPGLSYWALCRRV